MKAFFINLILAVACSATSILSRSVLDAASQNCDRAELLETSVVTVGENTVNLASFACPSLKKRDPFPPLISGSDGMNRRSASECTDTRGVECECGQAVSCGCSNVTALTPNPNDCNILIDATTVLSEETGPTFTVKPKTFNLITFQSCGIFYTNTFIETVEYCWDELSVFSSLVNQNCFQADTGTAGTCLANDGKFNIELLNIGA